MSKKKNLLKDNEKISKNKKIKKGTKKYTIIPFNDKWGNFSIALFFTFFILGVSFIALGGILTNTIYNGYYDASLTNSIVSQDDAIHYGTLSVVSDVLFIIGRIIIVNVPIILSFALLPVFKIKLNIFNVLLSIISYITVLFLSIVFIGALNSSVSLGTTSNESIVNDGIIKYKMEYQPYLCKYWGFNIFSGYTWFIGFSIPFLISSLNKSVEKFKKIDNNIFSATIFTFIYVFGALFFIVSLSISYSFLFPIIVTAFDSAGEFIATNQDRLSSKFLTGFLKVISVPFGQFSVLSTSIISNSSSINDFSVSDYNNVSNLTFEFINDNLGVSMTPNLLDSNIISTGQFDLSNGSQKYFLSVMATALILSTFSMEWFRNRSLVSKKSSLISKISKSIYVLFLYIFSVVLIIGGHVIPIFLLFFIFSPITFAIAAAFYGIAFMIPSIFSINYINYQSIDLSLMTAPNSSIDFAIHSGNFLVGSNSSIAYSFIICFLLSFVLSGFLTLYNTKISNLKPENTIYIDTSGNKIETNITVNSKNFNIDRATSIELPPKVDSKNHMSNESYSKYNNGISKNTSKYPYKNPTLPKHKEDILEKKDISLLSEKSKYNNNYIDELNQKIQHNIISEIAFDKYTKPINKNKPNIYYDNSKGVLDKEYKYKN